MKTTTDVVEPESLTYYESDSNPDSELELLQAGGQQAEQEDRQEDGQAGRRAGRETGRKMSRMMKVMRMM